MPDRAFLDTNILIYALTDTDLAKQAVARRLLGSSSSVISAQVLMEATNVLVRKAHVPVRDAAHGLRPLLGRAVVETTPDLVQRAWQISERYGFAIFDASIVAAALSARCKVLYTEDLQDGQTIEGVRVVDPFVA